MGLRDRLKERLKKGLKNIKALASVVHEESKYPGRPQPHMAARNPMWGGDESPPESSSEIQQETSSVETFPEDERAPDGGQFWFLKGDAEGWHETNPGQKKD